MAPRFIISIHSQKRFGGVSAASHAAALAVEWGAPDAGLLVRNRDHLAAERGVPAGAPRARAKLRATMASVTVKSRSDASASPVMRRHV